MNKVQEAKLNMYHAVLSYCDLNSATIGNMPALETSLEEFRATTVAIVDCYQQQAEIISGHAATKKSLREALIQEATSVAARLFSFGLSARNILLQNKVNLSARQFEKLKDEQLGPVCRNVAGAARPFVSQLEPYNIKAADLNDFDNHIAEYMASVPLPRSAVSSRHSFGETMLDLYTKNDGLLKGHLDRQLREFNKTDKQFYVGYKNARIILNNSSTASQIKVQVTNKKTKAKLRGATITVLENDTVATDSDDGKYSISPIPPATYTLKVDLKGFASQTIDDVLVKLGKVKSVKVEMEEGI